MKSIYAVEAIQMSDGARFVSRYFQTKRAARSWARWLRTQSYLSDVRIMEGGPGGMEIA